MLLVHDDQAEVCDGREHRRARAHADARPALAQPPPLRVALGRAQPRVQHGDGLAEAIDEASDDLRRQRDLGDEHDRPPPLRERRRGHAQVDLGLARARDPVQQALLWPALLDSRDQRRQHLLLVARQLVGIGAARPDGQVAQSATGAALAPAEAAGGVGGKHEAERAGDRRAVLLRDPLGEAHELARNPELERAQRREQLSRRPRCVAHADDHAEHLAAPERHDEHRADAHDPAPQLLGQAVVERAAQRAAGRHRLYLGDRRTSPGHVDPPPVRARRPSAAPAPGRCAPR